MNTPGLPMSFVGETGMWQNAHDTYLESRIASADPAELVRILYQACLRSVRDARSHLANGEIAARSRSISKAGEILAELTASLDRERGGEIADRLAHLYDYIQRKLTEANFHQADPPLAEVLGLLVTLSEAWEGIRQPVVETVSNSAWAQPLGPEASSYASQGWSL